MSTLYTARSVFRQLQGEPDYYTQQMRKMVLGAVIQVDFDRTEQFLRELDGLIGTSRGQVETLGRYLDQLDRKKKKGQERRDYQEAIKLRWMFRVYVDKLEEIRKNIITTMRLFGETERVIARHGERLVSGMVTTIVAPREAAENPLLNFSSLVAKTTIGTAASISEQKIDGIAEMEALARKSSENKTIDPTAVQVRVNQILKKDAEGKLLSIDWGLVEKLMQQESNNVSATDAVALIKVFMELEATGDAETKDNLNKFLEKGYWVVPTIHSGVTCEQHGCSLGETVGTYGNLEQQHAVLKPTPMFEMVLGLTVGTTSQKGLYEAKVDDIAKNIAAYGDLKNRDEHMQQLNRLAILTNVMGDPGYGTYYLDRYTEAAHAQDLFDWSINNPNQGIALNKDDWLESSGRPIEITHWSDISSEYIMTFHFLVGMGIAPDLDDHKTVHLNFHKIPERSIIGRPVLASTEDLGSLISGLVTDNQKANKSETKNDLEIWGGALLSAAKEKVAMIETIGNIVGKGSSTVTGVLGFAWDVGTDLADGHKENAEKIKLNIEIDGHINIQNLCLRVTTLGGWIQVSSQGERHENHTINSMILNENEVFIRTQVINQILTDAGVNKQFESPEALQEFLFSEEVLLMKMDRDSVEKDVLDAINRRGLEERVAEMKNNLLIEYELKSGEDNANKTALYDITVDELERLYQSL